MPLPIVDPPLINTANPWATTAEDLQKLFDCPHTGAVTTRTSLLHGFEHNPAVHQYAFFNPQDLSSKPASSDGEVPAEASASLNTLGYSPIPLGAYLATIVKVVAESTLPDDRRKDKPFIISVTGSAEAVKECYDKIRATQHAMEHPLCMEINLSCPNIPDKPPPAYSGHSLIEYLQTLTSVKDGRVPIGIKTPPYTYHDQFQTLINALLACKPCPIDFITATNTLGSSLILADHEGTPVINSTSGSGMGGMAGAPLHPLALGNVRTIRSMLDQHEELKLIEIIGAGGVSDRAGFHRMQAVGAKVVGVGTALGGQGINVFTDINQA